MFSSRDPNYLIDFAPLFIYKAFEQTGIRPDTVALGLAVGYYSAKDKLLIRVRSFEVNGERIELNCSVFPQAVGIWLDWSSVNPNRSNGNYMVLDVGFNTVDMVFIRNGSVSKEGSWMMDGEGTVKIVKHLADLIQQKLSIQVSPYIAKTLFERKSLIVYGKERRLDRIISGLSPDYAQRLFFLLQDRCGEEFRNLDGIIIGGGGAYYIRDSIPKQLRNIVEVMEEPEFANARGFYKSLKEKEKENENKTQ